MSKLSLWDLYKMGVPVSSTSRYQRRIVPLRLPQVSGSGSVRSWTDRRS